MIRNNPISKIYIKGDGIITSDPKFVIQEKGKLFLLVHLKNVTSATGYGESQIAAEMLACGKYWKELDSGLPKEEEVEIQRWPAKNGLRAGFNFAEPIDRQTVFEALAKIRESLLIKSNDEVQTEAVTAGGSGSNK
ncbi:unnamed protein product [Rhizophagus irregularis]|nr:unnamed protein product [Rhizophagus irregularis]